MFKPTAFLAAVLLPAVAQAATVYTERDAFLAALGGAPTVVDGFDRSIADARSVVLDSGVTSDALGGVAPMDGENAVFGNDTVGNGFFAGGVDGAAELAPERPRFAFPGTVTAFGGFFFEPLSLGLLIVADDFDGGARRR